MTATPAGLVEDITRIFIFEHWARYYHSKERDGATRLEVPAEVVEAFAAAHPDLAPLLREMNDTTITYESSCRLVSQFVLRLLDGVKYPSGQTAAALDSRDFQLEMHLFSLWLKGHEVFLDKRPMTFSDWLEHFAGWKSTAEVRRYRESLAASGPTGQPDSTALH